MSNVKKQIIVNIFITQTYTKNEIVFMTENLSKWFFKSVQISFFIRI